VTRSAARKRTSVVVRYDNTMRVNDLDQPIGPPVPNWTARPLPPRTVIPGRVCRVEPLEPRRHAPDLYDTIGASSDSRRWHSIVDTEWPSRKAAFEAWLAPENFDASGTQRQPLSACMAAAGI
jgi:hypothetical protein